MSCLVSIARKSANPEKRTSRLERQEKTTNMDAKNQPTDELKKQSMLAEAASYSTGLLVFWCIRSAIAIVQMGLVVNNLRLPNTFTTVGALMAFLGIIYSFYNVIIANRDQVRIERDQRLFNESILRTSSLLQRSVIAWVAIILFGSGFIAMLSDSFVLNSDNKLSLWIILDAYFHSISGLTCIINNRNDATEYLSRLGNSHANGTTPLLNPAAPSVFISVAGGGSSSGAASSPPTKKWKAVLLELLRGSTLWMLLWIILTVDSFSLTVSALVTINTSSKLLMVVCIYVGAIVLSLSLVVARYYIRKGRAERYQLQQIDLVTSSWAMLTLLLVVSMVAFLALYVVLIIGVIDAKLNFAESFIIISSAFSLASGVIGLVPNLNNWADFEIYEKGL